MPRSEILTEMTAYNWTNVSKMGIRKKRGLIFFHTDHEAISSLYVVVSGDSLSRYAMIATPALGQFAAYAMAGSSKVSNVAGICS